MFALHCSKISVHEYEEIGKQALNTAFLVCKLHGIDFKDVQYKVMQTNELLPSAERIGIIFMFATDKSQLELLNEKVAEAVEKYSMDRNDYMLTDWDNLLEFLTKLDKNLQLTNDVTQALVLSQMI